MGFLQPSEQSALCCQMPANHGQNIRFPAGLCGKFRAHSPYGRPEMRYFLSFLKACNHTPSCCCCCTGNSARTNRPRESVSTAAFTPERGFQRNSALAIAIATCTMGPERSEKHNDQVARNSLDSGSPASPPPVCLTQCRAKGYKLLPRRPGEAIAGLSERQSAAVLLRCCHTIPKAYPQKVHPCSFHFIQQHDFSLKVHVWLGAAS